MKKKILSLILSISLIFSAQSITGCFAEIPIEKSQSKEENNISEVNESLIEEYYKTYKELNDLILKKNAIIFAIHTAGATLLSLLVYSTCKLARMDIKTLIKANNLLSKNVKMAHGKQKAKNKN